jgi:hypothetical protein
VISLVVSQVHLSKVLIDRGSGLIIVFSKMLESMGHIGFVLQQVHPGYAQVLDL